MHLFHNIKMMFLFIHHFLFIDQQTGQVSNTKFFANVGYAIWCWLFPYAVYHGSSAPMDLWLVFGAVVIGNRTLNVMLQNKAGIPCDAANTWKGVDTTPPGAQPAPAQTTDVKVVVKTGPVVPDVSDLIDNNK